MGNSIMIIIKNLAIEGFKPVYLGSVALIIF